MRKLDYLLVVSWIAMVGCETAVEQTVAEPVAVVTPKLVECDGLLTAESVEDVCGAELELELIPNHGYCNIVVGGAAPLNNLKITVAEARARPPALLHAHNTDELERFRTLELANGGSEWTEYQRATGTYSHNVELITDKHWVHLRHSTWSDELANERCGLPAMRTLARLIAAKLETQEGAPTR